MAAEAERLFSLLDADGSNTLEMRELLKAMRDNKKVKDILASNERLKPLLQPKNYKTAFREINLSTDGHITLEEFTTFLDGQEGKPESKQGGAEKEDSSKGLPPPPPKQSEQAGAPQKSSKAKGKTETAPLPPPPPKKQEKVDKEKAPTKESDESKQAGGKSLPPPPPKKQEKVDEEGVPTKETEESKEAGAKSLPPPPPKKKEKTDHEKAPPQETDESKQAGGQSLPPPPPKKQEKADNGKAPQKESDESQQAGGQSLPPPPPKQQAAKEKVSGPPPPPADHKPPSAIEIQTDDESDYDSEQDEIEERAERARHQIEEARRELGIEEDFSDLFSKTPEVKAVGTVSGSKVPEKTKNEATIARPQSSADRKRLASIKTKNAPKDIFAGLLPTQKVFQLSPEHAAVAVPSLWGWRPASRAQTAPVQSLPGIGATANNLDLEEVMTAEERRSLYEDVIQKIPMYDGLEHLFGQCERLLQYNPTALRFQDLKERKRKKNVMKKFRYHHANLFFTNLREVIVILQNLPDEWGVPFLDEYWSWHFHNLAEKLEHTLREIDWLPEHGKPPIRAPQLAIVEYKEYVLTRSRKLAEEEHHHISPRRGVLEGDDGEITQLLTPALPRSSIIKLPKRDKHLVEWAHLIERCVKVLRCKKGVNAIGNSMIRLCQYVPEAKRYKNLHRRKRMVSHVTNFHLDICRKAFHCLENACNTASAMPRTYTDVNNNFWEMQLQEDAALVQDALNEVDWLPEASKATFRRAVYSLETFENYMIRLQKASRLSKGSGEKISTILPRMTGCGFFPEEHLIMTQEQHDDVRKEAHTLMPHVKKGLVSISDAVEALKNFKPAAGRYADAGEKRKRLAELTDFAHSQAQKFYIELKQIVHLRKQLPADWEDKYNDYWEMHLQDIAGEMKEALMEIDWLPESAKPTLRAAHLRMNAYKQHIKRAVHLDYGRRALDIDTYLKESIVRVKGKQNAHRATLSKREYDKRSLLKEKHHRSRKDSVVLKKLTNVRLRARRLQVTKEQALEVEQSTRLIIGNDAVDAVRRNFKKEFETAEKVIDDLRKLKSQPKRVNSTGRSNSPFARPHTAGGVSASGRTMANAIGTPYNVSVGPVTSFAGSNMQKLSDNAEEAVEIYNSFIISLEQSIVSFRQRIHRESQEKSVKERIACTRRINKRSKRRKKKSIKVFGGKFEKLLESKQREGLLPRKTFR